MLRSLQRRRRPEGRPKSIPAPFGGLNTRDAISDMAVTDALLMTNFFPTPSDVMLRKGYSDQVTYIAGGQVQSLMAYNSPSGTQALYAAAGSAIYNCTQATATASTAVSGFTNAKWEHTNFTNTGGTSFLLMVNAADGLRSFDGTNWATQIVTGTSASNFAHISQHKRRLWFCKDDTLEVWYLNVDSVAGTASRLDLSAFCRLGGEVMATSGWTLDAGEGMDDYFVSVTSNGEIIVYKGTDPTSASTWEMIGRWEVGKPLSRRCFAKFAGDIIYLAEDGVWPLANLLATERTKPRIALSDKIANSVKDAATNYRTNFGWQIFYWPRGTMVLANIPVATGGSQQQLVMNSITRAWGNFTGWNANCFEVYQGNLYFGGNGYVSQAWNTFADDGVAITGEVKQAFSNLGNPWRKQVTLARPILNTNGSPATSFGFNTDYSDSSVLATLTFSPTSYAVWDTATWDNGIWGGGLNVSSNWINVSALGITVAPRLRVQSSGIEVHWQATDTISLQGSAL